MPFCRWSENGKNMKETALARPRNCAQLLEVPRILGSCMQSPISEMLVLWRTQHNSLVGCSSSRWSAAHPQQCLEVLDMSDLHRWCSTCPRSSSVRMSVRTCCRRTASECLVGASITNTVREEKICNAPAALNARNKRATTNNE